MMALLDTVSLATTENSPLPFVDYLARLQRK